MLTVILSLPYLCRSVLVPFHFRYVYVSFPLRLRSISVTFTFHFRYVYVSFPLRFRFISVTFTFHFRYVYVSFPLRLRFILVSFLFRFRTESITIKYGTTTEQEKNGNGKVTKKSLYFTLRYCTSFQKNFQSKKIQKIINFLFK